MQKKANFVQVIGVFSCKFVANLKKQTQFMKGQNRRMYLFEKYL